MRSCGEIGWDVHWRVAKVFQTFRPPPEGKGSTSWVNEEDVVGMSHYAQAVKNRILRSRGLIRLGRGVPTVTAMVTQGFSQEMAAGEVNSIWVRELNHWTSWREGEFDGLSNLINFTGN